MPTIQTESGVIDLSPFFTPGKTVTVFYNSPEDVVTHDVYDGRHIWRRFTPAGVTVLYEYRDFSVPFDAGLFAQSDLLRSPQQFLLSPLDNRQTPSCFADSVMI